MRGRHKTDPAGTGSGTGSGPGSEGGAGGRPDVKRRVITGAILLVALIVAYFALAAFIPRWWSQRIGQAVNGQLSTGALLGFCFGLVFTIIPLGLLYATMRRPMSWKARVSWLALAAVLAAPNLMTLGVAIGTGGGSHAGQRTMDVDAPMFRGATAVGTLVGVLIFVVLVILYRRRPKARKAPDAPKAAQV